jgi:hypothetical protein
VIFSSISWHWHESMETQTLWRQDIPVTWSWNVLQSCMAWCWSGIQMWVSSMHQIWFTIQHCKWLTAFSCCLKAGKANGVKF